MISGLCGPPSTAPKAATCGTARRSSWYANGKPEQDGSYEYGKKAGTFTFWHENGQVAATGEYKADVAEGTWVWWHENGQKSAVGKYTNGTLIGEWRWWDEAGKLTKQKTYTGTESASTEPTRRLATDGEPTDGNQCRRLEAAREEHATLSDGRSIGTRKKHKPPPDFGPRGFFV